MRLFIALDLPERTADNLERSASQLKQLSAKGRFVAKQNYHLTLHFLGEVAESDVMYVQAAMDGETGDGNGGGGNGGGNSGEEENPLG